MSIDNSFSTFVPKFVLGLSIFSVCLAAPLAKSITTLSPIGIGFWRTMIVGIVMSVWTIQQHRKTLHNGASSSVFVQMNSSQLKWSVLSGVLLGWHFWAWFASLQYTSALRSTTLVCLNPIWVGCLQYFFYKNKPHLSFWVGTIISIMGVFFMSYVADDVTVSYIGDLLAVLGGIFGALYLSIGQRVREEVSIQIYGSVICLSAASSLFLSCLFTGDILIPTSNQDWIFLLLMALGPQFMGHIGMNYALGYIPATIVSVLLLLEPVGAGLLAIPMLGEIPKNQEVWGSLIIISGLAIVFYPKIISKESS